HRRHLHRHQPGDHVDDLRGAVQCAGRHEPDRKRNYQFQVLITRTSLVPSFLQTANRCEPAARTEVQVIANIPVPQISSPQIATLSNPQISTPQISTPQIATFSLAPAGGVEGENSFTTA